MRLCDCCLTEKHAEHASGLRNGDGDAADLLEVDVRLGLGLGVLRYQVRSKLSAWLRPMSGSVVVTCLMISSSARLHYIPRHTQPGADIITGSLDESAKPLWSAWPEACMMGSRRG